MSYMPPDEGPRYAPGAWGPSVGDGLAVDHLEPGTQPRSPQAYGRAATWISIPHQQESASHSAVQFTTDGRPPSPRPIPGLPTPAVPVRGPGELTDAEYMTVDPDEDMEVEPYDGYGWTDDWPGDDRKGKRKNFVGGFITGLRRLPKSILKGGTRNRRAPRQGTGGTAGSIHTGDSHIPTPLPQYESTPHLPAQGDVQYVEAMDMPVEDPLPPPSRVISPAPTTPVLSPRRAPPSTSEPSELRPEPHSRQTSGHRSHSHRSYRSSIYDPIRMGSSPPENGEPSSGARPQSPRTDDNIVPGTMRSPVLVEPRPTSDYERMSSPIHAGTEASFGSRVARLRQFFRDFYSLPWIAPDRIAVDYFPGQRNRYTKARAKLPDPGAQTWYNIPHNASLDLLAGSPSPPRPAVQPRYTEFPRPETNGHASPPDLHTANGRPAVPRSGPVPVMPEGQNGFPQYPLSYLPAQPIFFYPGPVPPGGSTTAGANYAPEMAQAMPVYMIAGAARPYVQPVTPNPSGVDHPRQHSARTGPGMTTVEPYPYPVPRPSQSQQ